jgi:hypothetical protein
MDVRVWSSAPPGPRVIRGCGSFVIVLPSFFLRGPSGADGRCKFLLLLFFFLNSVPLGFLIGVGGEY